MWNNQTGSAFRGSYWTPYDWENKTYHFDTPTPFEGYQQYPFTIHINDTYFEHYETLGYLFLGEGPPSGYWAWHIPSPMIPNNSVPPAPDQLVKITQISNPGDQAWTYPLHPISVDDASNIKTSIDRTGIISGYNALAYNSQGYSGQDDIDASTAGFAEGLFIIEHEHNPAPSGYEAVQYEYFAYDTDIDLVATRYHIFYDAIKHMMIPTSPMLQGLNIFAPQPYNPALPMSATNNPYGPAVAPGYNITSAEEYIVQIVNRTYIAVPDMWVKSIDGNGNLITGSPTYVIATMSNVLPQIPDMNLVYNPITGLSEPKLFDPITGLEVPTAQPRFNAFLFKLPVGMNFPFRLTIANS
jgi:hypothetical protein